jgi:ubiquinone/menaquinone biosynthesis C-methylase UbiE
MNPVRWFKDLLLQCFQLLANGVAALAMEHPSISAKFIPASQRSLFCVIPKASTTRRENSDELPIPPREIWENTYGSAGEYLATGRQHVAILRALLSEHQGDLKPGDRVMEMGCATGRLLRWFKDEAERGEFWGVDINANYISWDQQHLSPPFHFAATTTLPHLPFADEYFDLIYAGSVFSHVSELVDAWFLELRRILKVGGRLYITVHDNHTIDLLRTTLQSDALASMVAAQQSKLASIKEGFGMFTIRRSPRGAQVFYDREYLYRKLNPFFTVLAAKPEAYGHQTGILLARK